MKRLIILISGAIIINIGIVYPQTAEDRVNFFDGQFFLAEEEYTDALSAFQKVYKGDFVDNANLNYLIGVCYMRIKGQKKTAIKYLEKGATNVSRNYNEGSFRQESAPNEAYLLLANAYRINENLDKAREYYKKYLDLLNEKKEYEREFTNQQIANCTRAEEAIKNPVELKKESIGNIYNSRFNNYNPVMSGDGSRIAYMSEQRFYDAIYFVDINNSVWSNPVNITPQIQSDGDQYVTSLSHDGNTMFLSRINIDDADIMTSTFESTRWSKSINIGKPVNSKYYESHASISADGKKLYFLSNRKESLGGMDIFSSDLLEDGVSWSEPVNLGPNINTSLNEDSPFISNDGETLYFSSQGHSNIGGYDIFYSNLTGDNNWSTPIPYPYPLNTTDDDIFFFPIEEGYKGYMAIIEPDGLGGDDIYSISIVLDEEPTLEVTETVVVEEPIEEVTETVVVAEVAPEPEIEVEESPTIKYIIKPVFFGFDSHALSDIAKSKLNVLKEVMDAIPELIIEISSYTDAIGSENYNQILSNRRANSVSDYLVEIGVAKDKLSLKGNGENNPVAINETANGIDSSMGRKLNRRVEFKILSALNDFIIFEAVDVPENLKIK